MEFGRYLDTPPTAPEMKLISGIISGSGFTRKTVEDSLHKFAAEVHPKPLAKATVKDMNKFVSAAKHLSTYPAARACEEYGRYVAMRIFRHFRDSLLKQTKQ